MNIPILASWPPSTVLLLALICLASIACYILVSASVGQFSHRSTAGTSNPRHRLASLLGLLGDAPTASARTMAFGVLLLCIPIGAAMIGLLASLALSSVFSVCAAMILLARKACCGSLKRPWASSRYTDPTQDGVHVPFDRPPIAALAG